MVKGVVTEGKTAVVTTFQFDPKAVGILFQEHVAKHHYEWLIAAKEGDPEFEEKMRKVWLLTRFKLAKHYGLTDNTPEQWLADFKVNKCLICFQQFQDETRKKKFECCEYLVHDDCISTHYTKPGGDLNPQFNGQHHCPGCCKPMTQEKGKKMGLKFWKWFDSLQVIS